MNVRSQASPDFLRRNFCRGMVVRAGAPLLVRRSTPNRAWRRDVTLSLARMKSESLAPGAEIHTSLAARKRLARWKARIRDVVAELGILDRARPARVFG